MKKYLSIILTVVMLFSCLSAEVFAAAEPANGAGSVKAAQKIKLGDVDGDGDVDILDARYVLLNTVKSMSFDEMQNLAADVTLDGKITILDAKWILENVVGTRNLGEITLPEEDDGFVDPDGDEMKALKQEIDTAKGADTEGYTAQSIESLNNAVADAEKLLGKDNVTAEQIAKAIENMQVAQKALVTDTSALEKAVKDAYLKNTTGYLISTVDAYYEAVEQAKKVLADKNASPSQVAEALAAIEEAQANFEPVPDKTELKAAISEAEELDTEYMTPESVEILKTALENAKAVNSGERSSAAQIKEAIDALKEAQAALVFDYKAQLVKDLAAAEELDTAYYTKDTVDALNQAIEQARAVTEDPASTQESARAALEALENAIEALEFDTSEFNSAYEAATAIDPNGYTSASKSALSKAIEQADAVKANPDAAAEDYISATQALNDAIEGLKSDLTSLQRLIKNCSDQVGRFADKYTKSSIAVLQQAYDKANEITENNTPAEVQAAYDALEAAKNAAVKRVDVNDMDYALFTAYLKKARSTNFEEYTDESVQKLKAAIEQAEALEALGVEEMPADDVADCWPVLQSAIQGLVKK